MADWVGYRPWWEAQFDGGLTGTPFDFDLDALWISLHSNTYAPNMDTHDAYADITNEMANGNGYATGGLQLANLTLTRAGAVVTFDATGPGAIDPTWSQNAAGFTTARYAAIRKANADPNLAVPAFLLNFGADKGNVNGDLVIVFDPTGIFAFTLSV